MGGHEGVFDGEVKMPNIIIKPLQVPVVVEEEWKRGVPFYYLLIHTVGGQKFRVPIERVPIEIEEVL